MNLINKFTASILFAMLFMSFQTQAQTVELAYFKQNANVTQSQILNAAKAMDSTIHHWPGFISRELVHLGENKWVDIVHWSDANAANQAVQKAMHSDVCLTFFSLIQSSESDMHHGEIRLVQ